MQQIDIDFEVFKALTARRRSESHTYNEVVRQLLDIDLAQTTHEPSGLAQATGLMSKIMSINMVEPSGLSLRGLVLPNGSLLRATHKGKSYAVQIVDGRWLSDNELSYSSPSAAASAITGNNANGWRFWQAKRPSDTEWRNLDMLSKR